MLRRTKTFFDILREVSLDDIRDQATRQFTIVVTGYSIASRREAVQMLSGGISGPGSPVVEYDPAENWSRAFERASLVVYTLDSGQVSERDVELVRQITRAGVPVLLLSAGAPALIGSSRTLSQLDDYTSGADPDVQVVRVTSAEEPTELLRAVLRRLDAYDLAIARQLPPFRPLVAAQLISETSRANAEFALMTNLPAVIPVVGNIAAASADLFVLTKNQMLLIFKLAAVHGRDLDHSRTILTEMVPVIGASLFWRSLARELAALVPAGIGALPKTVIAYSGTYAAGQGAHYYYTTGAKPNNELMKRFYTEAMQRARQIVERRLRRREMD